MELAKRFTIGETWCEQTLKGVPGDKLPNVLDKAAELGYKPTDTLFDVLFAPTGNVLKLCGRIRSTRMSSTLLVMH